MSNDQKESGVRGALVDASAWHNLGRGMTLGDFSGSLCKIGLDLSNAAGPAAAVFEIVFDGKFFFLPMFWIPEDLVEDRTQVDRAPYAEWIRSGFVKTTPGRFVDKDFVVRDIMAALKEANLKLTGIVYDRWTIDTFCEAAGRQGFSFPMIEYGQGYKDTSPAIDKLFADINSGRIKHDGNPLLMLSAVSAIAKSDANGNRKFARTGAVRSGIVAATMVHSAFGVYAAEESRAAVKIGELLSTTKVKEKQFIRVTCDPVCDYNGPILTRNTKVMVGDQLITGITKLTLVADIDDVWRAEIHCNVIPENFSAEARMIYKHHHAPRPRIMDRLRKLYWSASERIGASLDTFWPIEAEDEATIRARVDRDIVDVDTTSLNSTAREFRCIPRPRKSLWDRLKSAIGRAK
jgi:hypothetical protein